MHPKYLENSLNAKFIVFAGFTVELVCICGSVVCTNVSDRFVYFLNLCIDLMDPGVIHLVSMKP